MKFYINNYIIVVLDIIHITVLKVYGCLQVQNLLNTNIWNGNKQCIRCMHNLPSQASEKYRFSALKPLNSCVIIMIEGPECKVYFSTVLQFNVTE
jgi:hypothetical protein